MNSLNPSSSSSISSGPDTTLLLPKVVECICASIRIVCGDEYADYLEKISSVRIYGHWTTSGDFQTSCAKDVFWKTRSVLPGKMKYDPISFTTISEFGRERIFTFKNPIELAQSIISNIKEEVWSEFISAMYVTGKEGLIIIVTKEHLGWQLSNHRLPCHICGCFLKGIKGLRMHQIIHHGIKYENAQKDATESKLWVIEYNPKSVLCKQPQNWLLSYENLMKVDKLNFDKGIEAASKGKLSDLIEIVNEGWDPHHAVDRNGSTALLWAAGGGHLEVCKYLVETCGVSCNELRGKEKMKRHALHWAARNNQVSVCKWLVNVHAVEVDVETEDGTTPLHFAAYNGSLSACEWLLSTGRCDVNKQNYYGCNTSQWCALLGDVTILKYFKSMGLDYTILNKNGHSALHKAAIKGKYDACVWLLTSEENGGAGLSKRHMLPDSDGFTPELFATSNGFHELGRFLSEKYLELG